MEYTPSNPENWVQVPNNYSDALNELANRKMENKIKLLPLGTKVFDIRYGFGTVIEIDADDDYVITVRYKRTHCVTRVSYTIEGKEDIEDNVPMLSLTEYNYFKGGFTPITDYGKPKVGDWGYFWDHEDNGRFAIYSKIEKIEIEGMYCLYKSIAKNYKYSHFSKEVPEHLK